jgi:hypothetical protein
VELRRLFPSIAFALMACAAASAFAQASPPQPRPIIDPRPGPLLVWFEADSTELPAEQLATIRRARTWGSQPQASLLLCYDDAVDAMGHKRLQAVAQALRAEGSPRVIADFDGWLCGHLMPFGALFSPPQEFPPGVILIYGLWDVR